MIVFCWHMAHTNFERSDRLRFISGMSSDETGIAGCLFSKAPIKIEHDAIAQKWIDQIRKATLDKINMAIAVAIKALSQNIRDMTNISRVGMTDRE